MERDGAERRLTTILAADVVGYSRLMAADEVGTLAQLKLHRKELIEPKTAAHHGRVVKLMGDGTLMEFGSVVNAVEFAVDVQRAMAERNAGIPEDQRVAYRIGINIGDIIAEGDDIFGDGVNIAARLEALAEPGGVCVSEKVYEEVRNKLNLRFKDRGHRQVKNIPEPVRIFQVLLEPEGAGRSATKSKAAKLSFSRWPMAAAVAIMALAAAVIILWLLSGQPDKPSIVVLPFTNVSDDTGQQDFADGMTIDLITRLASVSGLFVISRNSVVTLKDKDPREVAEEFHVRYVLEGSVRRIGDQLRINAQLIDATTGGIRWAQPYDGPAADVFGWQDKVIEQIVDALALQLLPQEAGRVARHDTDNVMAHDAYLRGLSFYYRHTPEDNAQAAAHLQRAIELDPDYSAAYTALAKVYVQTVIGENAYAEKLGIYWTEGYTRAWRLLEKGMAEPDADFHVLRSWLALKKHQEDQAVAEAKQALELSPNDADALEATAEALIYSGQPGEGIEYAEKAMLQNPTLLGRPLYLIGVAYFALGDTRKAIDNLERAIEEAPSSRADFSGILAAAYGELGLTDQASSAFDAFRQSISNRPALEWTVSPGLFVNPRAHTYSRIDLPWAVYSYPFADRSVLDRLAGGFRAAGATVSVGGYLPLYAMNRLSGAEIRSLIFGSEIQGKDLWISEPLWHQQRTDEGVVEHEGYPIHAGLPKHAAGIGRIQDDLLCEQWPVLTKTFEICVVIFRIPEPNARLRWGEYVMVTDMGPYPFSLGE